MLRKLQITLNYLDILRFQGRYRISLMLSRIRFAIAGNEIKSTNLFKQGKILKKVAILAIYPVSSPGYIKSIERLIRGLSLREYTIVCVSNRKIPQDIIDLLSNEMNFIAVRKNFGRDFGGYQAGFNWLKKQSEFQNVEHLILVNDTLLWFDNVESILGNLENKSWGCLFLNQEMHTHAQSFCLHFDNTVFTSQAFMDFWDSYLPTNYRRYAIVFGEVGLTNTLLKSGFTPRPVASLSSINEKTSANELSLELARVLPIGALQSARNLPLLFPGDLSASYSSYLAEIKKTTKFKTLPDYFSLENWLKRFIHSDPPHKIGLHLSLLKQLPMKRDMYKFHSLDNIFAALQVIDQDSADIYLADIENSAARFMLGTREMKRARRHGEV